MSNRYTIPVTIGNIHGDLIPSGDDTYDIGSATAAWQDLFLEGDIALSDATTIAVTASAHDTAGYTLAISAGDTTAGTTNNIAGGALTIQGGQGKGSGAGGDIIFQTANAAGSGSSLNALATALTISDDLSSTFAGAIVGSGTIDATTDFTIGDTVITDGVITDSSGLALAANVTVTGNVLPNADDTYDLGSASAAWQDLFLEGDITLTDAGSIATSAGALTIAPTTDTLFSDGTGVVIGHTAQVVTSNFLQNVASGVTAELQVLGGGVHDMAMVIGAFNTNDDYPPTLTFLKSGNGTVGSNTIVADDEILGSIAFTAADGNDFRSMAAAISVQIDGTPGQDDVPGRMMFWTTADGASAPTKRWSILATGELQGNGAKTISTSSGALTIDPAAELNLTLAANTNGAFIVSDGTTTLQKLDTRNTTPALSTHVFDSPNQTLDNASAANTVHQLVEFAAYDITLSGQTQVTTSQRTVNIESTQLRESGGAVTVDQASTFRIAGAPYPFSDVTITEALALHVDSGTSRFDGAISLGTDHGDDGQQLTSGGDDAACDWTAASSLREHKDIGSEADSGEALQAMLDSKAYHFRYKTKKGTGDSKTEYVGLMADDAPWAMHYKGTIVNPVNTLGYTVLAVQALNEKIERLEALLEERR